MPAVEVKALEKLAEAVTARLDWDAAAGAAAFALVAIVVSRAVFRRGLRSYSGASA